jgi:hypothetical protein
METKEKKAAPRAKKEVPANYLVKTKGYKETFPTIERARNQYEILKKRAIKNQEKVKIELFEQKKGSNPELVDIVNIDESFYND